MIGDPGRIRTCDHSLRRRVLYPTELRGRGQLVIEAGRHDRQLPRSKHARSEANPVVTEIVGVTFRLLDAVMGFDDSIVEAVFLGKRHRLLERGKA